MRKPYSGKWMMVFTVEMDLPSEFNSNFGELSEELAGIDLTSELYRVTNNRTWKHVASIPKTDYWLKKKETTFGIQWEDETTSKGEQELTRDAQKAESRLR